MPDNNIINGKTVSREGLWRPGYHFTPARGWMNDPVGLIFYRGQYHLFYQYNPYSCNWGSMHWGHAVSTDLARWKDLPIALYPDQSYDAHPEGGCFSGCAVEHEGKLFVFYTGSVKKNGHTVQSQCMAVSEDGVHFRKWKLNPVIPHPPEEGVEDFRDPKVLYHDGMWYMVVSGAVGDAQLPSSDGRIYLYASEDLYTWEYRGILLRSGHRLGSMFECPDLFYLDGRWVLTCSPMNHPRYNKAMYCIGDVDFENCRFEISRIGCLDYGYDYYAQQSFTDASGQRTGIAWMNGWLWMPWCSNWGPTGSEGWRGALSFPRRLTVMPDDTLRSYPAASWEKLILPGAEYRDLVVREEKVCLDTPSDNCYALRLKLRIGQAVSRNLEIGLMDDGTQCAILRVDLMTGILALDMDRSDRCRKGVASCVLEVPECVEDTLELMVLVDHSCVEVFAQNGSTCLSCNIYPEKNQTGCWLRTPYKETVIEQILLNPMDTAYEREGEGINIQADDGDADGDTGYGRIEEKKEGKEETLSA